MQQLCLHFLTGLRSRIARRGLWHELAGVSYLYLCSHQTDVPILTFYGWRTNSHKLIILTSYGWRKNTNVIRVTQRHHDTHTDRDVIRLTQPRTTTANTLYHVPNVIQLLHKSTTYLHIHWRHAPNILNLSSHNAEQLRKATVPISTRQQFPQSHGNSSTLHTQPLQSPRRSTSTDDADHQRHSTEKDIPRTRPTNNTLIKLDFSA